jgi:hypothetical protein
VSVRMERCSENPARRSECPRCDRETEQRQRRNQVPPVPTCCVRCNSARQLKDDSGIRPFFQPEKSRNHQGYCSRDLKDAEDRQDVHWVSQAGSNLGHKRTLTTPVRPCVRSITPPANVSSAMSDVVVQYNIVLAFTSNRPFACEAQQLSRTVHPGDAAINRSFPISGFVLPD